MLYIILAIIFALAGFVVPFILNPNKEHAKAVHVFGNTVGLGLAFIMICLTSLINIDGVGHMKKLYTGDAMPQGQVIACKNEMGPQADVMQPGFHFILGGEILYDIEDLNPITVPAGSVGILTARDGNPLAAGVIAAPAFKPSEFKKMVEDASYFLGDGGGYKGPQTSVLTPGVYKMNRYLWDVKLVPATVVEEGYVGIIKSNSRTSVKFGNFNRDLPEDCSPIKNNLAEGYLDASLVPVGCVGIWDKALTPGVYNINSDIFKVTPFPVRAQAWTYKGGFERKWIDVGVTPSGEITQEEHGEPVPIPETAADSAVTVKVDGWEIPQELRIVAQVSPDKAPFVYASVGGLVEIEDKIMTPIIRSLVRNAMGGSITVTEPIVNKDGAYKTDDSGNVVTHEITRPIEVLDLITQRTVLEARIEETAKAEGIKAGVTVKEVRLAEPQTPPALLVAGKRKQLADQLIKTFQKEQEAQTERIKAEKAKSEADRQDDLVAAEINVQKAKLDAQAAKAAGEGERDRLIAVSDGQKAQVDVLGSDKVYGLKQQELFLDKAIELIRTNPNAINAILANAGKLVPHTVINTGGGSGSLDSAAAIFGTLTNKSQTQN